MSMIELVFSIVIMGIVVASLPTILLQTQNNNAFAMQQETITAGRTKLGDILTYQWDENSYDVNQSSISMVLDTTLAATDDELERNSTVRRLGHVFSDSRRKFFNANTAPTGAVDGLDDVDDFDGTSEELTIAPADEVAITGGLDYLFDVNISTRVEYITDAADYSQQTIDDFFFTNANIVGSSNVKMVEITVNGGPTPVTLRAYTFNIGGNQILPPRTYNP